MANVPEGGFKADEDIVCYKVVRRKSFDTCFRGAYRRSASYRLGERVESEITLGNDRLFDSYIFSARKSVWRRRYVLDCEIGYLRRHSRVSVVSDASGISYSKKGLYSHTHYMNEAMESTLGCMHRYHPHDEVAVARCVIPAGSRYYVSQSGMVFVSDALRVEGFINIKKPARDEKHSRFAWKAL